MTLTFVDVYNRVAEQAWSMYDADAETAEDFESGLKSSINKALSELWCSYAFPFRVKEYTVSLSPDNPTNKYAMPDGIIYKKLINGTQTYSVRLDNIGYLANTDKIDVFTPGVGEPTAFQVYNDSILLDAIPDKEYKLIVEYLELAIGEDSMGDKLYELANDDDTIVVPEKYEVLFRNALVTKSMVYAIADKSDENYSGYLDQYENAYKTLVKYCMGIDTDKRIIL